MIVATERNAFSRSEAGPEPAAPRAHVSKPFSVERPRSVSIEILFLAHHLKQNQESLSSSLWGVDCSSGRVRACMINSHSGRSSRVSRVGRHPGAAPYCDTIQRSEGIEAPRVKYAGSPGTCSGSVTRARAPSSMRNVTVRSSRGSSRHVAARSSCCI